MEFEPPNNKQQSNLSEFDDEKKYPSGVKEQEAEAEIDEFEEDKSEHKSENV